MSSADDIIQKHRQRLEEHKQFLDQKKQAKASTNNNSGGGGQLSARSTGSRDDPTSAREYTDRSSRRFDTVAQNDDTPVADGQYDDHQQESQPRKSSGAAGQRRSLNNNHSSYQSRQHYDPSSPARSTSRLTEGDNGSYYTDDPTRVFEDNYLWQQKRERSIAEQKKEGYVREMEGCTFKPNTNHSGSTTREVRASLSKERESEPLYGPSADVSMTNHVLRQRQGRREKEKANFRLNGNVDIKNWEPRTTQPKEFNLGKKKHDGISSLRKPIAWHSGNQQQQGGDNRKQQAPQQQSRSLVNDDRRGEESHSSGALSEEQQRRIREYRARKEHQGLNNAGDEDNLNHQNHSGGGGGGGNLQQLEVIEAMDHTITNQENEIARLKGIIQAQRRELDVAKAKVRQMALSAQQAQDL